MIVTPSLYACMAEALDLIEVGVRYFGAFLARYECKQLLDVSIGSNLFADTS